MIYKIPITNNPNQSLRVVIPMNNRNIPLRLRIRYNSMAEYWTMTIIDGKTDKILVDSLPMLAGQNILAQYSYLRIGSAFLMPTSELDITDEPTVENLGTEYVLLWGDNNE